MTRTLGFSIFGTGGYVCYKDYTRYRRMEDTYRRGNILPPLDDNVNEVCYFSRPDTEADLRHILAPTFTNEYYLIQGEIGTGKTRSLLEIVRSMHREQRQLKRGAPVYVLASQGKSFPEALGEAVGFNFDEHLSFSLFMDFVLGVRSFPSQDTHNRLQRVLQAIEESAFLYSQKEGVPVILVIDGADNLDKHLPGTLAKLQDKAKLWADANIAKVVFVTNDEETEELFKQNPGNWSRMGAPYIMGDLTRQDAVSFLCGDKFMETKTQAKRLPAMTIKEAEEVFDLVGGRMSHLITFKREHMAGIPRPVTASRLERKEREKFICAAKDIKLLEVIDKVKQAGGRIAMKTLVTVTSRDHVIELAKQNVLRLERELQGVEVAFESRLTENVARQLKTGR